MATCKNCGTILRSGNKTGYCSVCAPPEKHKGAIHNPFFPYAEAGEDKQWDRFLIKIRAEVARVFDTSVSALEVRRKGDIDAHSVSQLAIQRILADFFRVSVSDVVRFGKIPRDVVAQMRDEAEILHRHDADFREKCKKVRSALETIGRDILPECADTAAIPVKGETYEEYKPYVRFTRTVAQPVRRFVAPRTAREGTDT